MLGCGNFGGIGSAPAFFERGETKEQAFELMDAAWAMGLDWFDTADAYGGGRSEAWIGEWIAATGNRPRITTKTFNPMEEGGDSGLSPERVRRQLASSLERLGIDRVDLYLAHEPDPATPVAATVGAFEQAVEDGLVADGPEQLRLARARRGAHGRAANAAAELVLAARPRRRGGRDPALLVGGHRVPGVRTARRRLADRQVPTRSGAARRLADDDAPGAVREVRQRARLWRSKGWRRRPPSAGSAWPALALAWLLSHPGVTSIVVGPRTPTHLAPVREALALELGPAEHDEVGSLFT